MAEELAPGVHLVAGAFVPGTQPDGNSVVLTGDQGVIVVDTGRHAAHTAAVLESARSTGLPIVAVVNTHWHLDHVGGNPRVRAAFPEVTVHASPAIEGALGGFLARYRGQLESMIASSEDESAKAPLRAELAILDAGDGLKPDVPITESGSRTLGGRTLELHLERFAVTEGDLWLLDPATRLLIAGDLVTLPAPFLDTACPRGWQEALGKLADADFALLVPGHGPPMDRATFTRYRAAFDGLLACAASDSSSDQCIDGWLAGVGDLVPESESVFARRMVDYYVGQHLRGDEDRQARLCGEQSDAED